MIGLFLAIILIILGFTVMWFNNIRDSRGGHSDGWITGCCCAVIGALVLLFFSFLPTSIGWANQVGDKNAVNQFKANEAIYRGKAQAITTELKSYLAIQYPGFERGVIDKIASNPHALFVLYPQLQSSRTIVSLTNTIVQLQNQVYEQQINLTQVTKDIRTRRQNPFYLGFLLP